jgi:hypothetical protein
MLEFIFYSAIVCAATVLIYVFSSTWWPVKWPPKTRLYISWGVGAIVSGMMSWADTPFMAILTGVACAFVICYFVARKDVDVCANCGAWQSFKYVETRNKNYTHGMSTVDISREIQNNHGECIGKIVDGYADVPVIRYEKDTVYRCQQCGAEKVVHEKGSFRVD